MKCNNCGKELKENANFCDNCGCPVAQTELPQQNNQKGQPQQWQPQPIQYMSQPQKPNKKFYKRWYFWVIVVAAIAMIGSVAINSGEGNSSYSNEQGTSTASVIEEKTEETTEESTTAESTTVEPTTQDPTKDNSQSEQEFKDSCSTISFDDLSRNPDKYKGNNYKFTGEIIQVQEGWFDTYDLRINVTKEEFEYIDDVLWTDTIYATVTIPDGEDKLLEDDVITFWGTCDGDYSYTSVLGSKISLPKIDIEYYEINN